VLFVFLAGGREHFGHIPAVARVQLEASAGLSVVSGQLLAQLQLGVPRQKKR
jgi:hypothetical protein